MTSSSAWSQRGKTAQCVAQIFCSPKKLSHLVQMLILPSQISNYFHSKSQSYIWVPHLIRHLSPDSAYVLHPSFKTCVLHLKSNFTFKLYPAIYLCNWILTSRFTIACDVWIPNIKFWNFEIACDISKLTLQTHLSLESSKEIDLPVLSETRSCLRWRTVGVRMYNIRSTMRSTRQTGGKDYRRSQQGGRGRRNGSGNPGIQGNSGTSLACSHI